MSGEPRPRTWATSSPGSQVSKPISGEESAPLVSGEHTPQLVWPSRDEELGALEAFAPEANTPRALVVETSSAAETPSASSLSPSTRQEPEDGPEHGRGGTSSGRPDAIESRSGSSLDSARDQPLDPARGGPVERRESEGPSAGSSPGAVQPATLGQPAPPTEAAGRGGAGSPTGHTFLAPSTRAPGAPPSILHDRQAEPSVSIATGRSRRLMRLLLVGLILAVLAQGIYIAVRFFGPGRGGGATADGEIIIESRPSGVDVAIDGRPRGRTPLSVRVWPGYHVVELRAGGVVRRQHVGVAAGQVASQYVELGGAAPPSDTPEPVANAGALVITSDPSGAQVEIGGQTRGTTPLTLKELSVGRHSVRLSREGIEQTRDVQIRGGQTTNLAVALAPKPPPQPQTGQVTIASKIPVTVLEKGEVLGSSDGGQLALRPGRHVLTLVNETYGFRNEQMIDVAAGRGLTVAVTLPDGQLHANATPWAEVFVNGRSLGETPIGQATLPVGRYELVFRHPKLGERRVPVTIRADEPAVATVDFSQ
ncbi:MAG: PEGA domain-containing protein [Luteitalea sp.]|nr:PEGA domain-containing protein [Luteitalea sp.]